MAGWMDALRDDYIHGEPNAMALHPILSHLLWPIGQPVIMIMTMSKMYRRIDGYYCEA